MQTFLKYTFIDVQIHSRHLEHQTFRHLPKQVDLRQVDDFVATLR